MTPDYMQVATQRYVEGRELVLGSRYRVHRDPDIAWLQVAQFMGGERLGAEWFLQGLQRCLGTPTRTVRALRALADRIEAEQQMEHAC